MRRHTLLGKQFLSKFSHAYFHDNIWLIILLIVTLFFRLYRVFDRYSLGNESIRDANVAIVGAAHWQFPLTGPFASIGPFTTGPLYWWQLIFSRILLSTDYAPWIFLSITSILFIFIMYKIGELLGDKRLGFTIGILTAVSAYIVNWSTLLTNPTGVFLYAALSIWIFLKIIKQHVSHWWGLALGLSVGIGLSTHYQMAAYLIFVLALLVNKRKRVQYFLAACLGLFLAYLPFLIFDLMHKWYMLRTIIYSYIHLKDLVYVANSWKIYLFQFWPQAWASTFALPLVVGVILMVGVLSVLGFMFVKKKMSKELIALSIIFFIMFVQLRYYGGERFMGYIHYMMPLIFIFTGLSIWYLNFLKFGKVVYYFVLVSILLLMFPASLRQIQPDATVVALQSKARAIVQQYPDQKFSLYQCDKETSNELLSLLFLLNKEGKLDDNGMRLTLDTLSCASEVTKKSPVQLSRVSLSDNATILRLRATNDASLKKYGWYHYTMKSLYNNSALWWVGKKL